MGKKRRKGASRYNIYTLEVPGTVAPWPPARAARPSRAGTGAGASPCRLPAAAALGAEGFGFAELSPRVHLQARTQTPNDLAARRPPFGACDSRRWAEGSSGSHRCD